MLTQTNGPQDHIRRVDALVKHWLQDRQTLIAMMMAIKEEQGAKTGCSVLAQHVQSLCEVMMDYVSAGHFEIYDELMAEAEQRGSRHLAEGLALYPHLQVTTDVVLRFNDLHDGSAEADIIERLPMELVELLPALEQRFEIEDKMIALLHRRIATTNA